MVVMQQDAAVEEEAEKGDVAPTALPMPLFGTLCPLVLYSFYKCLCYLRLKESFS